MEVCPEVCDTYNLDPELLHLPGDDEQMKKKISEVEMKFGMPQAFGFIDGIVPILKPRES